MFRQSPLNKMGSRDSFRSSQYYKSGATSRDRFKEDQKTRSERRSEIMSNNRFNVLEDGVTENEIQCSNAAAKPQKPPPITVTDIEVAVLKAAIDTTNTKSEVYFKVLHDSVKIITQNHDDFKTVNDFCVSKQYECNTHPYRSDQNLKICLFGLPEVNIDKLKAELLKYEVTPHDIKTITPKKPYGKGSLKIYLLFFKRSNGVKIRNLRSISQLLSFFVRWEYFSPKKSDKNEPTPTQCTRCQGFGHGQEYCRRSYKCVSCGQGHPSKDCTQRKTIPNADSTVNQKPRVPDNLVKCANCGDNHTSNFRGCVTRKQYVERIIKAKERNSSTQRATLPNLGSTEAYPHLNTPASTSYLNQHFNNTTTTPQLQHHQWQNPGISSFDTEGFNKILQAQQKQTFEMVTAMMNSLMTAMLSKMEDMFSNLIKNIFNNNKCTSNNNNHVLV